MVARLRMLRGFWFSFSLHRLAHCSICSAVTLLPNNEDLRRSPMDLRLPTYLVYYLLDHVAYVTTLVYNLLQRNLVLFPIPRTGLQAYAKILRVDAVPL